MPHWSRRMSSMLSTQRFAALTRSWPPWWPAAIAVILTLPFAVFCFGLTLAGSVAFDWRIYMMAGELAWSGGDLYGWSDIYGFVYSPLFAYGFPAISWIGPDLWRIAHLGAALALPTWPTRVITLVSWPFWSDVQNGNLFVFVLLAAVWGLRGSRLAALTYLGMFLLMPRPLMVPVAVWLLYARPDIRWMFGAMTALSLVGVMASGYLGLWVTRLMESPDISTSTANFALTRFIGQWWLLIGLPLGVWLTWRARLGWASLAVSPYLLSQYFLMGILELLPKPTSTPDLVGERAKALGPIPAVEDTKPTEPRDRRAGVS